MTAASCANNVFGSGELEARTESASKKRRLDHAASPRHLHAAFQVPGAKVSLC